MTRLLTIVMYHYVRDRKGAHFPEIKGLTTDQFYGQIGYLKRNYQILSAEDLFKIINATKELPPRAALLTFDDGYVDHFKNVLPILQKEEIPACFFIPARAILEQEVLDVNKIHFILAAVEDKSILVNLINQKIQRSVPGSQLESAQSYWDRLAKASRFDPPEVIFIKRMLQRELPPELRKEIVNDLFNRFVTTNEQSFARELYMDAKMIQTLIENGMYIGSHGFDHVWLNHLNEREQEREVSVSMDFLGTFGIDTTQWMMCYPHGGWNDTLLQVLRRQGCLAAVTTRIDLADLDRDDPLTLPRLDTNDLPKMVDAPLSEWTLKGS